MLDGHGVLWMTPVATAALVCAFGTSVALVLTKKHHGHLTLDSTIGVQKVHVEPTPRVGGLGIYLGLLVAWVLMRNGGVREILGVVLAAGLIPFAFGLAEDITKRVGVLPRLAATMTGGIVAWMLTGVTLNRLDVYGLDWLMAFTPVAVMFTAFAVGGVANAINIIDGFHGLASGTTIIALVALGAISTQTGDAQLAMACFLVATAIGGFWLVNYPWGKLFMGDGGAYFSGFALAWLAVLLPIRNPRVSVWAGLLVCAYPVIEVLYSIWRRAKKRHSPGAPDSGHLHSLIRLKLIQSRPEEFSGTGNVAVSPIIWAFSSLCAIGATAFFNQPLVLAAGVVLCVATYHVGYSYLAVPATDASPASGRRSDVARRRPRRQTGPHRSQRSRDQHTRVSD